MADQVEYNWDEITGRTTERLRAPKVVPVPAGIVRQAQRAFDGVPHPTKEGKLVHTLSHTFPDAATAAQFYRLVKKAGEHTTPRSSVTAVINPDPEGRLDPEHPTTDCDVSWRAGSKRGPKSDDSDD